MPPRPTLPWEPPRAGVVRGGVLFAALAALVACSSGCSRAAADPPAGSVAAIDEGPDPASAVEPRDEFEPEPELLTTFETLVDPEAAFADGFRAPLDRSWRVAGSGDATAAKPAAIRAMARGRVTIDSGGTLHVRHRWIDNYVPREITMAVSGASAAVADGALVERGAVLARGTAARVWLEGETASPAEFAATHDWAPVPAAEPQLALISHRDLELRLYRSGVETGRFQVGRGQAWGRKERRGDNRTPKGVYFIADKSRGPFGGPSAAYFGGYWMRINYPNAFDAARGVEAGLITPTQQREITRAWRAKKETTKHTALGGGIGLHGWAYEWFDGGSRAMSWGCVVMHLRDADTIYGALDPGAMVVLF